MRKGTLCLPVALLLSIFFTAAALAQAPVKERQFVYGVNAFAGRDYVGTFYPPTVNTLYLLADTRSIVSPRYTLLYFWPITNEYKVDWDSLNETVTGTLEILRRGKLLHSLSQTKYVIQHPRGPDAGEVHLYIGREAEAQYQEFQRQRQAYRDRVWEYYEATRRYQEQLEEELAKGERGEEVSIPDPPLEPEPFMFFSTSLNDGFPIELPAGAYSIRIRGADGQIVPQSERKLIVFSPRREGLGYTIIPQTKWTTPEQADDPSRVIYARSGSSMYLQPFVEEEHNELYYTCLAKPQSTEGSSDRWVWVHIQPKDGGYLEVLRDGQVIGRVERKPYWVKQIPGPALGYEVVEYQAGGEGSRPRSPDFEGYEIRVEPGQPSYAIRLVEPDGSVVVGSEREIRLVKTRNLWALYLLPLLPLTAGVSLTVWRRGKVAPRQDKVS